MRCTSTLFAILLAGAVLPGCGKRTVVQVPPQVDLYSFDIIGVVEFASDSQGTLASFATQRFIESVQQAQRGVRVLELGSADEVKRAVKRDELDFEAMRAIGERYGVGAVVLGVLEVEDVKPRIDLQHMLSTASVSADVKASLTTRLLETGHGANVWTRSTRAASTVAHVGVAGGGVSFDAKDPERAYGAMVDALVQDLTRDFRVTYVEQ